MSNRDRIGRMRAEAEATEREQKKERKEQAPKAGAKKGPVGTGRLMLVWAVKDGYGEVVATFPYPKKASAEAEAARLKEANQRAYIVCPHKVPF